MWWQLVGPRWACRSAGSRRASEILARTVTPRGSRAATNARQGVRAGTQRSRTAQRRGACEPPGTDSQRVRGRMLRRPSVAGGGFETKPKKINDLRWFRPLETVSEAATRDPRSGGRRRRVRVSDRAGRLRGPRGGGWRRAASGPARAAGGSRRPSAPGALPRGARRGGRVRGLPRVATCSSARSPVAGGGGAGGAGRAGQRALLQEAIDAGDAAAVAVAALQFGAQLKAGDRAASGAQLVDDLLDLGVWRGGEGGPLADHNGK